MVKKLRLTVLVEDSVKPSRKARGLKAKHGLSILVEVPKPKISILLDTDTSPEVLLNNIGVLDIDLNKIAVIVLSHGHYDHTGGLIDLLKSMKQTVPVIAHPKIFNLKLKTEPHLKYIGPPFKKSDVEASGGMLLLARSSVTIADGIKTTGEIERVTPYERVRGFWTIEEEEFLRDVMPDDQALVLNVKKKGLVIVSGCAHAGIVNTIRQAQKITGISRIYAVIGGFHLIGSSKERIALTIKDLAEIDPDYLYPCHCTGSKAIRKIAEKFRERCRTVSTGDIIEI